MPKFLGGDQHAEASAVEREGAVGVARTNRAWGWVAAAVVMISLAPFLVVDVPAVLDYPNHLARFYILAHPDDANLARMYAPHWAILPNLGVDVLGGALLSVLPPDVGGRILLALSLLAPLAGTAVYARAAFGRWTWWSLGAGVITFNAIFFLGFMNFLLALGLALAGAGAWRIWRRGERKLIAPVGGLLVGLAAFFCHILGFAYFAVLIAADEVEALLRLRKEGRLTWRHTLSVAALLAATLGPTLVLYVVTHQASAAGDGLAWRWSAKVLQLVTPFMTYDKPATIVTAAVVGSIIILVWRRSQRAEGVGLGLAMVGALYLVAPSAAAGGTFVDTRLPLMAALLLFAGLAPRLSARAAVAVGVAFTLLIVGRSAHVAANWQGRARDLADLRAGLAYVEPGSKILPARTAYPDSTFSGRGRVLPNVAPLNEHLGALAVIERHAFWPLLFADPSQQPLVVTPAYADVALPLGFITPWEDLADQPRASSQPGEQRYLTNWRARFDYVLLLGPSAPTGSTPRGLTLLHAGDAASVYRIDEDGHARPPH